MKNYIQEGITVSLTTPSGGVVSGQPVLFTNLFAVALADYAETVTGQYVTEGVVSLTKVTTDTIDPGQVLYWDDTAKKVTETATSNYKIGVALETAGNGVTTVSVRLDGIAVIQEAGE